MNYSDTAKELSIWDIVGLFNEEKHECPTTERLMFIETKSRQEGELSNLFPCYLNTYHIANDDVIDRFRMDIFQMVHGETELVRVEFNTKDLGVNKRIWDSPPSAELRMSRPFLEAEVQ